MPVSKTVIAAAAAAAASTNAEVRAAEGKMPRDAAVVINVLRSMGVTEWEPRVVNMLMEFIHRYTSQVLSDSVAYTKHRGGAEVNVDDVKLAIETKLMREFHAPASVEDMRDRAAALNAIPLPELSNRPGIHVPQDDNLLGAHVQYFPRPGGVLIGEEGRRDDLTALEDSRELADGVGVGVGAGGGGGGGGDVEMADAGAEPTEMREHDAIKVKMSAGGKKGKK